MSKLAFREDEEAGVVRCFISTLDGSERSEIGTMSLPLLRKIPRLFPVWVALMQDAYQTAIEDATGDKVVGFQTYRPHEQN